MEEALRSIQLPAGVPWLETLALTSPKPVQIDNTHDDLKRETEFYMVTLQGVKKGLAQLESSGVPFKRPEDYFAEMVKTDTHMAKVKDVLLAEHKRIEAVAIRKHNQEHKKFAKETRVAKIEEKAKEKRDSLSAIEEFKKKKLDQGELSIQVRGMELWFFLLLCLVFSFFV